MLRARKRRRTDIRRDDAQQPARVGLGDEAGSAELERLVAGRLIVVRREHHDGRRMGVPAAGDTHRPQHFDTGHIRQGHVEQNQRDRRAAADERQSLCSAVDGLRVKARRAKSDTNERARGA